MLMMIKSGEVAKTKFSVLYTYSRIHGIFCRSTSGMSLTTIGMRTNAIPIIMKSIPREVKGSSVFICLKTTCWQRLNLYLLSFYV